MIYSCKYKSLHNFIIWIIKIILTIFVINPHNQKWRKIRSSSLLLFKMTRDSRFVLFVLLYYNKSIKSVFNLPSKNCVSRQTLFCKVLKQTFPNFKTHIIHMRASSNGSYFRNHHQSNQKIISFIVSDKVRLSSKAGARFKRTSLAFMRTWLT